MKRGLLLLLAIMIFVLSACSGQNNENNQSAVEQPAPNGSDELLPEEGAELTIWTVPDPVLEEAIVEFEKEYNIKVKLENVFFTETLNRLKTDGPAGMGADLISFGNDRVGEAVKAGLILPNDYFEEETKNRNIQTAIDGMSYDGILYGYPQYMYTYALFVNKELVKDAKLETWDDIKAFSKTFNDIPNNKYGFMMDPGIYYSYAFMSAYGGYVFGDNGTNKDDIGINNEGAIKGMEYLQSLKEILPVNVSDLTLDVKTGLFEEGKVAINLADSFQAAGFKELPFEVEVLPLPKLPGGDEPNPFAGISGYYVSAYSKYPNAAKILANYLTTEEMQLEKASISPDIPVAKSINANSDQFKDDAIKQGFLKQAQNAVQMPNIAEMTFFWENVGPTIELIWNGEDVKKTLDKAAKDMKEDIEAGN